MNSTPTRNAPKLKTRRHSFSEVLILSSSLTRIETDLQLKEDAHSLSSSLLFTPLRLKGNLCMSIQYLLQASYFHLQQIVLRNKRNKGSMNSLVPSHYETDRAFSVFLSTSLRHSLSLFPSLLLLFSLTLFESLSFLSENDPEVTDKITCSIMLILTL